MNCMIIDKKVISLYQYQKDTRFNTISPFQGYVPAYTPYVELNAQFVPNHSGPKYQKYGGNPNLAIVQLNTSEIDIMNEFRKLWEQHDVWTRSTIVSIVFDLPDINDVTQRLLRNPKDFEKALAPFYGSVIVAKFSDLLTDHLVIAAELVKAAKAGNTQAAADAEKRWYDNAAAIANLLGDINPYWSEEEWNEMLKQHLGLVKTQAVNMLSGNYAAAVAVYDQIEEQTLAMADSMTFGILDQFPNSFIH